MYNCSLIPQVSGIFFQSYWFTTLYSIPDKQSPVRSMVLSRVLLVATGLWIPEEVKFVGSNLVEGYESISTDPEEYKNQAVLILGKGNSAFETAQNILGRASRIHLYSPSPVRLAWQTHYVGDLRCSIFCMSV